ncbi:MauE/DoxX family redox-associated membrane protein [Chryseolinea lacunae]|uniref:Methylamine utilisation protein MauE domain-containing protein n=1 Tax=Chryseolinea lacunae TaxID=2801331 RepID=A0ABS1KR68_9BACT|nr:MauE/DoxX family redox-associated membrane protein [Chryseolinea lacunae]MBL0741939.1 hypothetical protein [Chryseolinea lacunae]
MIALAAATTPDQLCRRLNVLTTVVSVAFLFGIALSARLWISDRAFPLVPVHPFFVTLLRPANVALLTVVIVLLGVIPFRKSKWVFLAVIGTLVLLVAEDQMRLQPWVYFYALIFLPFVFTSHNKNDDVNNIVRCLQVLFVACYFWSGVQKLHPNFLDNTFADILKRLFRITDTAPYKPLGYGIPLFEILTGFFLLFVRTRNVGIALAMASHLFILLYLSPLGANANYVVYPWNVAMVLSVFLLFFKNTNTLFVFPEGIRSTFLQAGFVVLAGVMPALNFAGWWDHYLSFSLYADRINYLFVAIEASEMKNLNGRYNPYVIQVPGLSGGSIVNVEAWSMAELHVPVYPEPRVFNVIAQRFCSHDIPEGKIVFMETTLPLSSTTLQTYTCARFSRPIYDPH